MLRTFNILSTIAVAAILALYLSTAAFLLPSSNINFSMKGQAWGQKLHLKKPLFILPEGDLRPFPYMRLSHQMRRQDKSYKLATRHLGTQPKAFYSSVKVPEINTTFAGLENVLSGTSHSSAVPTDFAQHLETSEQNVDAQAMARGSDFDNLLATFTDKPPLPATLISEQLNGSLAVSDIPSKAGRYTGASERNIFIVENMPTPSSEPDIPATEAAPSPKTTPDLFAVEPAPNPAAEPNIFALEPTPKSLAEPDIFAVQPAPKPVAEPDIFAVQPAPKPVAEPDIFAVQPAPKPVAEPDIFANEIITPPLSEPGLSELSRASSGAQASQTMSSLRGILDFTPYQQNEEAKTSLDEAVFGAVEFYPSRDIATHRIAAAVASLDAIKAGNRPRVDIELSKSVEKYMTKTIKGEKGGYRNSNRASSAQISLEYDIFTGYRIQNSILREKASLEETKIDSLSTINDLVLNIIAVYFDIVNFSQIEKILFRQLSFHNELKSLVTEQVRQGIASVADETSITARITEIQVETQANEKKLVEAKIKYQALVGVSPDTLDFSTIARKTELIPITPAKADALIASSNYSMRLINSRIDIFKADMGVKKAAFYPSLSMRMEGRSSFEQDGAQGRTNDVSARLVLRMNLYNGGADGARVTEARSKIGQLKATRELFFSEARESSGRLYANKKIADERLGTLYQQQEARKKSLSETFSLYNLNQKSLIELLDATNDVYSATIDILKTTNELILTNFQLQHLHGTLLNAFNIQESVINQLNGSGDQ